MLKIKQLASLSIITLIFLFLARSILTNWNVFVSFLQDFTILNLSVIFLLLSLLVILNTLSWHIATLTIGLRVGLFENTYLWMVSNLSRYLPGGIWQYVGRIYMLSQLGISKMHSAGALALESIMNLLVGALVVIAMGSMRNNMSLIWLSLLCILLIVFLVFTNVRFITFVSNLVYKLTERDISLSGVKISPKWLPVLVVFFGAQFCVAGLVLYLMTLNTFDIPISYIPIFIGVFASSWLLGYIALFAPAGLGIQEGSIAVLLSFYIPLPLASIIAISFRIFSVITELAVLSITAIIYKVIKYKAVI